MGCWKGGRKFDILFVYLTSRQCIRGTKLNDSFQIHISDISNRILSGGRWSRPGPNHWRELAEVRTHGDGHRLSLAVAMVSRPSSDTNITPGSRSATQLSEPRSNHPYPRSLGTYTRWAKNVRPRKDLGWKCGRLYVKTNMTSHHERLHRSE